jgi:hypothetical protein
MATEASRSGAGTNTRKSDENEEQEESDSQPAPVLSLDTQAKDQHAGQGQPLRNPSTIAMLHAGGKGHPQVAMRHEGNTSCHRLRGILRKRPDSLDRF